MASYALKLPNGEHAILTFEYQDDGQGVEIHMRRVERNRTDALLALKLGTEPALYVNPNINTAETGLATDGGVLGIHGYTFDGA